VAASPRGEFRKPTAIERTFNRIFGWMVSAGIGPRDSYLLEVTGRKSGRTYSTPVYIMEIANRTFLVCPRGRAQWVINAEASGKLWLRRGPERTEYSIRKAPSIDKPELLRAYLSRFKFTVQRYFPVQDGSPASAFVPIARRYPVFELIPQVVSETAT
jgi:deazaflavin-dependent oxidoreductase (nitroreductase family)